FVPRQYFDNCRKKSSECDSTMTCLADPAILQIDKDVHVCRNESRLVNGSSNTTIRSAMSARLRTCAMKNASANVLRSPALRVLRNDGVPAGVFSLPSSTSLPRISKE